MNRFNVFNKMEKETILQGLKRERYIWNDVLRYEQRPVDFINEIESLIKELKESLDE